jgi:hypothetical protein
MKTNQLTGAALDWAVATCEGATDFRYDTVATYWVTLDGKDRALRSGWAQSYLPSTDWAQGGPIIERELIEIVRGGAYAENFWKATRNSSTVYGSTPLIAAMRCYVASKMGDEVELPKED